MFENIFEGWRVGCNALREAREAGEIDIEKDIKIDERANQGKLMSKTVTTNAFDKNKVVVDHMHGDNNLETDVLKEKEQLKEVKAQLPLPLFRFESTHKPKFITYIKDIVNTARVMLYRENNARWVALIPYVRIIDWSDITHLVNLSIMRNKDAKAIESKKLNIPVITCFYEKKLRVKYDIPEDQIINVDEYANYVLDKKTITNTFKSFFKSISEQNKLKQQGIFKDIEVNLILDSGSEDYGIGYTIEVAYTKTIDYQNWRRGKENYDMVDIDHDFKEELLIEDKKREEFIEKSELQDSQSEEEMLRCMEEKLNEFAIEEQNSINSLNFSQEDDNSEGFGDNNQENQGASDDPVDDFATGDGTPGSGDGDDNGMGNMGGNDESNGFGDDGNGGDNNGGFGDNSENQGGQDDQQQQSTKPKTQPGEHPFAELNGKHKTLQELKILENEIDRVIEPLKNNFNDPIIEKFESLKEVVKDAIRITFQTNIEDSLLRYTLYVNQYENLVLQLKKKLEEQKESK